MNRALVPVAAIAAVTAWHGAAAATERAVSPNQPPTLDSRELSVTLPTEPEEPLRFTVSASDPDSDVVAIGIEGLPAGAFVERERDQSYVSVEWPGAEAGEYDLLVTLDDGKVRIQRRMRLRIEEEWESFFLPGAGYSMYAQSGGGVAHGGRVEIAIGSWIHRNGNRGPSHGRVLVDLDLLFPPDGGPSIFVPSLALDLSFERNPQRSWLLPAFGLAAGWVLPSGGRSTGMVTPHVALHLYTSTNLFVTATGGYLLPFSTSSFDERRGVRASLSVDYSMW
ncbi:MAG: hypothetical protein IT376_00485 [Polyangiaceae bacterium]|nr:hypothetical protein [Polyangiaceae bacterium]